MSSHRIGDRDLDNGRYDVIDPAGGVQRGKGVKIFDGKTNSGDPVTAYRRSDGVYVLDGRSSTQRQGKPPNPLQMPALKDNCDGYLKGQIFNCGAGEKEISASWILLRSESGPDWLFSVWNPYKQSIEALGLVPRQLPTRPGQPGDPPPPNPPPPQDLDAPWQMLAYATVFNIPYAYTLPYCSWSAGSPWPRPANPATVIESIGGTQTFANGGPAGGTNGYYWQPEGWNYSTAAFRVWENGVGYPDNFQAATGQIHVVWKVAQGVESPPIPAFWRYQSVVFPYGWGAVQSVNQTLVNLTQSCPIETPGLPEPPQPPLPPRPPNAPLDPNDYKATITAVGQQCFVVIKDHKNISNLSQYDRLRCWVCSPSETPRIRYNPSDKDWRFALSLEACSNTYKDDNYSNLGQGKLWQVLPDDRPASNAIRPAGLLPIQEYYPNPDCSIGNPARSYRGFVPQMNFSDYTVLGVASIASKRRS